MIHFSDPILTCKEAVAFEEAYFGGDLKKTWEAIKHAGSGIGYAVLKDYLECGNLYSVTHVLTLVGKGHNGADALIAASILAREIPSVKIDVVFVFGERSLKPLARKAWVQLQQTNQVNVSSCEEKNLKHAYSVVLDGVFGASFRGAIPDEVLKLFQKVDALKIDLRAAVDLPSGLNLAGAFKADFTYATGCVKTELLGCVNAGRIRYIDLAFFNACEVVGQGTQRVLKKQILSPLTSLRPSHSDKRTYGHLFIVGGSMRYPGAVLMAVKSALRSGVGLVTAFIPEPLVPSYAAAAPEAMWVGMPVDKKTGGMTKLGFGKIKSLWNNATSLVVGPGMGSSEETLKLLKEIFKSVKVPCVIDADALQKSLIELLSTPTILTPHYGEFNRIAGRNELRDLSSKSGATVILKGPYTRIMSLDGNTYVSTYGGPVLARGGSGDMLAGLVGGIVAQFPNDLTLAAAQAVVLHGVASDLLAQTVGQTAIQITELANYYSKALRSVNSV